MKGLVVRKSSNGKGVFASKDFSAGKEVIRIGGDVIDLKDLVPDSYIDHHCLQISKSKYLGPSGKVDDYLNHSCEPNCGLKNMGDEFWIVTISPIKKGDELTWDYSTDMDEDEWTMKCSCGKKTCRKVIRNFRDLPINLQERYIRLGVVPDFILKGR